MSTWFVKTTADDVDHYIEEFFVGPLMAVIPMHMRDCRVYVTIEGNSGHVANITYAEGFGKAFKKRNMSVLYASPTVPKLVIAGKIGRYTDADIKENAVQLFQSHLNHNTVFFDTQFVGDKLGLYQQLLRIRRELKGMTPKTMAPKFYITGKLGSYDKHGYKRMNTIYFVDFINYSLTYIFFNLDAPP